jgi:hypothetical protein
MTLVTDNAHGDFTSRPPSAAEAANASPASTALEKNGSASHHSRRSAASISRRSPSYSPRFLSPTRGRNPPPSEPLPLSQFSPAPSRSLTLALALALRALDRVLSLVSSRALAAFDASACALWRKCIRKRSLLAQQRLKTTFMSYPCGPSWKVGKVAPLRDQAVMQGAPSGCDRRGSSILAAVQVMPGAPAAVAEAGQTRYHWRAGAEAEPARQACRAGRHDHPRRMHSVEV